MADIRCALCDSPVPPETGVKFLVSDAERQALNTDVLEFTYCAPCHNIMQDPKAAVSIVTSLIEAKFKELGLATDTEEFRRHLLNKLGSYVRSIGKN